MNKFYLFKFNYILIFFYFLIFIFFPNRSFSEWQSVGDPGFSTTSADYPSLAITNGSVLYVSFISFSNDSKVSVMKFEGTNWVQVGNDGFTPGGAYEDDLAVDGETPYVVYSDWLNADKASVMKFDGTDWVQVGLPGFTAGRAVFTCLVFYESSPYVAYRDEANDSKASVMKFDGTDWVQVGLPGFTAGEAYSISLAFDGSTPYVAYTDGANDSKASVMKFDGTDWVQVGLPGFTAGEAYSISLAFDGSTPYMAYQDFAYYNKASVMKFDGTDWVHVGVPGFTAGGTDYTSLAFDGSTPYVVYTDKANDNKASAMKFDGTDWVHVGVPGFTAGGTDYTSLAFDGSTPYVVYLDEANAGKTSVMRYETPSSPNTPPTATVSISGSEYVGNTLTGSYTYEDDEDDEQGTSTYRWLRDNIAIDGQTSTTYTTTNDDLNKTIKFEVTPVALTGELTGTPVVSSGLLIERRSNKTGSIISPIIIIPEIEIPRDICPNIIGFQTEIPNNFIINENNECVYFYYEEIKDSEIINPLPEITNTVSPEEIINSESNIDQNDSSLQSDTLLNINQEKNKISIFNYFKNIIFEKFNLFIKNPLNKITTETTVITGLILGFYFSIIKTLFLSPISFSEIPLIPIRFWNLIMIAFGFKKKTQPWGTVYDSTTKQPLDPVYVTVLDLNGNEVATCITDLDGRYGFLLPPGIYQIKAGKNNYQFPSNKLQGETSDIIYQDLYFGGNIEVKEGEVVTRNIPMDPIKFDWNEFVKKDKNLMKFYSRKELWIVIISNWLFNFGFIFSIIFTSINQSIFNFSILGLYIVIFILRKTILKPRPFGQIFDQNNNPLAFAILRVFYPNSQNEIIHRVSDKNGKYYCLIPNGSYYVKIENKNDDESYSAIYTSELIEVKKGYLHTKFKI